MPRFALLLFLACSLAASAQDDHSLPDRAPEDLVVIEVAAGSGPELRRDEYVVVHYEGWIWDDSAPQHKGRLFDSSRERGMPLSLMYRPTRMIEGWFHGLQGMKSGGRRILLIPPKLGYGKRTAFGEIPPDSHLIFDIELLDVVPAHAR